MDMRKIVIIPALLLCGVLGWSADWLTDGYDSQRTHWQKDEKLISPTTAKNIKLLWKIQLAGDYGGESTFVLGSNSPLRLGPDGTLYCLAFMGLAGDEWGWMPVATPSGRPIAAAAQRRGTHWPYQPAAVGLRLLAETYTPPNADTAPHEERFALIDRRGRLVRAWRVLSRTDFGGLGKQMTPELVGHDLVVALPVTSATTSRVCRPSARGPRCRKSLFTALCDVGQQSLARPPDRR